MTSPSDKDSLSPKPLAGWEWWVAFYNARLERNRLERAKLEAIERIIRRGGKDPF